MPSKLNLPVRPSCKERNIAKANCVHILNAINSKPIYCSTYTSE